MRSSKILLAALAAAAMAAAGCAHAVVEPGHRALLFDPRHGGIQQEVLKPGYVDLSCGLFRSVCPRVDDFDVTYSTKKEEIVTNSVEGLPLTLRVSIIYKPVIAELYLLDTEVGPNYYDEVIGPEFKSTARGVFARHSYLELQKKNESIENEIEAELKRRTKGKHVDISSVLLESVNYAPEIAAQVRAKLIAEQEAARQKAAQENEAVRQKRALEIEAEHTQRRIEADASQRKQHTEAEATQHKLEIQSEAEQQRLKLEAEAEKRRLEVKLASDTEKARIESELRNKDAERKLAEQQLHVTRLHADAQVSAARGEADARAQLARATAEEKRAEAAAITPMHVMMHAYDALGHLGGSGTTIMLGDWSRIPSFLFPRIPAFQAMFGGAYGGGPFLTPPAQMPTSHANDASGDVNTSTARR